MQFNFADKMKRGRKGKVDLNDQIEIYRECAKDLVDENNKIRPAGLDIGYL